MFVKQSGASRGFSATAKLLASFELKLGTTCNTQTCFQVKKDSGLWYSAEYSSFSLGPESDNYRLSVSGYSGDAGDAIVAPANPALRVANGIQFSTPDRDNDNHPAECASQDGWWYNCCSRCVINKDSSGAWNAVTDAWVADVTDARMMVKLD